MTKFSKRLFSVVIAIILILVTAIPCFSAAELLDSTKKVGITMNCSKPDYEFTVYKVATLDSTTTSPYQTSYNSLIADISDEIISGKTADVLAALDEIETMPSTAKVVGKFTTSATSTSKTINDLAQGIYYVRATNYPAGVKSVTNSVVALPYYDGSDWVYAIDDIELAEKVVDDVPTTEKTITNSTKNNVNYTDVSLGDTVNFSIKSTTAGSSSMRLNSYTIYDDMSAGLTLDKNSFNVALLKKDGTKITDLKSSDYKVNITKEKDGENTTFNVALTKTYLQGTQFYGSDVYYTDITYSAVLNKYAVVGTAGNPNEEVKLQYSNKNDVTSAVEGNTVYVYTYALKTNKFDTSGTALEGAKFNLYDNKANADEVKNEIATGVSDKNGLTLYYNNKGEEMRLQSGTYYIVETEAPEGYNLYGKVIEITINAEYGETFVNDTYVTNCPENGYASVDVKDTKLVTPQTGGYGTAMFYIIGAVTFAAGVFFFFYRKKIKN
jgi:LPXTG-motif cell wall-anchored protein